MSEIEEIAKTTGKAIEAAREAGGFLARFIHRSVEQASGIVGDWLTYVRWERQQRLMDRANEFMRERGVTVPSRAIGLYTMWSSMEPASPAITTRSLPASSATSVTQGW